MVREIVTDPIRLQHKSERATKDDYDIIKDLIDTAMSYPECVGLSAVQIGLHKRICVIKIRNNAWSILINPMIYNTHGGKYVSEEGCLSLQGIRKVDRWKTVDVLSYNQKGKVQKARFSGISAAAVQHEMDHFDGKLI